jgi:hypothetical protein
MVDTSAAKAFMLKRSLPASDSKDCTPTDFRVFEEYVMGVCGATAHDIFEAQLAQSNFDVFMSRIDPDIPSAPTVESEEKQSKEPVKQVEQSPVKPPKPVEPFKAPEPPKAEKSAVVPDVKPEVKPNVVTPQEPVNPEKTLAETVEASDKTVEVKIEEANSAGDQAKSE